MYYRFNGEVVGRQSVDLRICACPGRDRKTEEGKLNPSSRKSTGSSTVPSPNSSQKRNISNQNTPVNRQQNLSQGTDSYHIYGMLSPVSLSLNTYVTPTCHIAEIQERTTPVITHVQTGYNIQPPYNTITYAYIHTRFNIIPFSLLQFLRQRSILLINAPEVPMKENSHSGSRAKRTLKFCQRFVTPLSFAIWYLMMSEISSYSSVVTMSKYCTRRHTIHAVAIFSPTGHHRHNLMLHSSQSAASSCCLPIHVYFLS